MHYVRWLLIILTYMSYGASFVFLKELVTIADPMLMVMWRLGLSGVCFLGWFLITGGKTKRFDRIDAYLLMQFLIFGIAGSFCLSAWAAQYVSSTKACFYFNLAPFMTAIFAYLVYQRVLGLYQILGGLVAFMGFAPHLYYLARTSICVVCFLPLPILPDIVMILAVASYAYGWIALDKLKKRGHADSFIIGIGMLGVSIGLLLASPWYPPLRELPMQGIFWINLILVILTGNIIFFALYGYLLRYFRPTLLSFMGMMSPLFTAVLSWYVLGQNISYHFFVTLLLVTLGLYLFTRS